VGERRSRIEVGERTVDRVDALIAPVLERLGYEVVLVELIAAYERPSLRVSIDRLDLSGQVSLEDCVRVNRALEDLPELDALMPGAYNLEVSSPGVNRPLVRERDFRRFIGEKAQISIREPLDGRRNFTGRISKVEGGEVTLDLGKPGVVSIEIQSISRAHLKPDTADLFKRSSHQPPLGELVLEGGRRRGG
jgi:ribosome maturation factor RimP